MEDSLAHKCFDCSAIDKEAEDAERKSPWMVTATGFAEVEENPRSHPSRVRDVLTVDRGYRFRWALNPRLISGTPSAFWLIFVHEPILPRRRGGVEEKYQRVKSRTVAKTA